MERRRATPAVEGSADRRHASKHDDGVHRGIFDPRTAPFNADLLNYLQRSGGNTAVSDLLATSPRSSKPAADTRSINGSGPESQPSLPVQRTPPATYEMISIYIFELNEWPKVTSTRSEKIERNTLADFLRKTPLSSTQRIGYRIRDLYIRIQDPLNNPPGSESAMVTKTRYEDTQAEVNATIIDMKNENKENIQLWLQALQMYLYADIHRPHDHPSREEMENPQRDLGKSSCIATLILPNGMAKLQKVNPSQGAIDKAYGLDEKRAAGLQPAQPTIVPFGFTGEIDPTDLHKLSVGEIARMNADKNGAKHTVYTDDYKSDYDPLQDEERAGKQRDLEHCLKEVGQMRDKIRAIRQDADNKIHEIGAEVRKLERLAQRKRGAEGSNRSTDINAQIAAKKQELAELSSEDARKGREAATKAAENQPELLAHLTRAGELREQLLSNIRFVLVP